MTSGHTDTGVEAALARLPKVELHCHLEGTMRPDTVRDLARSNGVALPVTDPTELYEYASLDEFLEVFWLIQSTLGNRTDWTRLAYESVVDAAAAGIVYREAFFTPARHLAAGQDLVEIIAGLSEGLVAGEAETGTRTMLVCDIDRAYGGSAAHELVERLTEACRANAPGTERILGVGMDSTERNVDPADFVDAYTLAARAGLRRTAHQGENSPPSAIAACVDQLGVERIDHGLSLLDDPALTARLAAERVPVTVCPTSNIRIANLVSRLEDHPFPRMRAAGLLATVNTDDPAMIGLDLAAEYNAVRGAYGYGWEDMVALAEDGIDSAWLDPGERSRLRTHLWETADRLMPGSSPESRE